MKQAVCYICGSDNHLEAHHILSCSQGRKLRLTKEQLDDTRNLITLCLKCHKLTYRKRGRGCKDPAFIDKLGEAKKDVGFYSWFEEIKATVSPGKRQLLCLSETYGFYFRSPKGKKRKLKVRNKVARYPRRWALEREMERLDMEFKAIVKVA